MPRADQGPPTQALPARHIVITGLVCDFQDLGLGESDTEKWRLLVTQQWETEAANFSPKVFLIDQPPAAGQLIGITMTGLMTLSWSLHQELYTITADFQLILYQCNGQDCVSLTGSAGKHTYRTFNLPSGSPDDLYSAFSPSFSKCIQEAQQQLVESSFNLLPWQTVVEKVNGNEIGIKASQIDNLEPGNLLSLGRGSTVVETIATIQVLEVSPSTDQLTTCTYYGEGQPEAQVGDKVYVSTSAGLRKP